MTRQPSEATRRKHAGWPERLLDTRGLKVRLRRAAQNAYVVLPAGLEGELGYSSSWNRLEFTGNACECCGVKPRISRMSWKDFDVIRPMLDQLEGGSQ